MKADERVVPFRESMLTQLLQTYFVGKGKKAQEGRVADLNPFRQLPISRLSFGRLINYS